MLDMVNVAVNHLMNVLVVMKKLAMNLVHGRTGLNVPNSVVVVIHRDREIVILAIVLEWVALSKLEDVTRKHANMVNGQAGVNVMYDNVEKWAKKRVLESAMETHVGEVELIELTATKNVPK